MSSHESSNPLLTPEGAPLKNPGDIEKSLAAMWIQPKDRESAAKATRICAANLIVVTHPDDWHELNNDLGELSALYPTRTIAVILHENKVSAPSKSIRASVSAICHVPQPGRPQVCAEQIILHDELEHTTDLVHTLLPMLEAELPCLLWWRIARPETDDLFDRLKKTSDRIILDAGLTGLESLDAKAGPNVRELGWYRTYPYRELLAQMFDKAPADSFSKINTITVQLPADEVEQKAEAIWIIAFVAGQLGWQPLETQDPGKYVFRGIDNNVAVTIKPPADETETQTDGLQQLTIESNGHTFMICRCCPETHEYRAIVCDQRLCEIPRCLQLPRTTRSQALAAAATGRAEDPAFQRAAPLAAWLARGFHQ